MDLCDCKIYPEAEDAIAEEALERLRDLLDLDGHFGCVEC